MDCGWSQGPSGSSEPQALSSGRFLSSYLCGRCGRWRRDLLREAGCDCGRGNEAWEVVGILGDMSVLYSYVYIYIHTQLYIHLYVHVYIHILSSVPTPFPPGHGHGSAIVLSPSAGVVLYGW